MTLQKQLVHLNLTGGLQKKDDQFIVIPSKLVKADDVEFDDLSTVKRRGGQAQVSLTSLSASIPVRQGVRLFSHQGRALVESRGDSLSSGTLGGGVHRVNSSGNTRPVGNPTQVSGFISPYRFRRAGMVTERVMSVDRKGSAYGGSSVPNYDGSYDFALMNGYRFYAAETRDTAGTGRQTIRVTIIDDATGFKLAETLLSDGSNVLVKPRIVASSGATTYLYFASFTSGAASFSVKCVSLSSSGVGAINSVLTTAATGGTIEGTTSDAALFDAAYSSDKTTLGLVVRDATAAGTTLLFRNLSPSDGYTILNSASGTASARVRSLACLTTYDNTSYRIHAFYGINTAVAKAMHYTIGVATSAETTVGTASSGTVGRLTAYENSTTQIYLAFDAYSSPGAMTVSTTRISRFAHDYTSLTECAASGPWLIAGRIESAQGRLYMPMFFLSANFQTTFYIVDVTDAALNLGVAGSTGASWQVLARIDYGEGALDSNRWQLTTRVPNLVTSGNSVNFTYLKYETDLRLAGTSNETPYALHRASIDLQSQLQHKEVNGLTFLAGACPYVFDGSAMVEENFHHGPEIDTSAALTTSGYQLPNASASYTVCFTVAWQDAQGNWHESAPSNERTFAVTSGSGNYYIPTSAVVLPPTQKANYQVVMYRTKALGTDTSLYLASKVDGTFVTSDTDLDDGEQIYTAGSVLPNTPAPACRHVSLFQKRLVLSGCGDGSRVYWSKQTQVGYGPEFSSGDPTHQTVVPSDKGRVAGTEEMDDKLVVLCENGVGIIYGNGPDPTGTQGQYSDFSSMITETGCSWDSPKSIIRGPEGVWFRSPFGIRLVSRGGGLARAQDGKQLGSEVDSLVSGTLVAVAGDAKQQVRFYQSSGTCLVWDYQWQQWTRFTGMANVDAVYADDRYYHLSNISTTPMLRYTSDSVSTDVNDAGTTAQSFTATIKTAWLSFAGIQGYQRAYRLMVLGKTTDASQAVQVCGVTSYYDFDETTVLSGASVSSNVTPGAGGQLQFQHHFVKQKCESLQIEITFRPSGSTSCLRLTDLTLQVGVKSGYNKLPSTARF